MPSLIKDDPSAEELSAIVWGVTNHELWAVRTASIRDRSARELLLATIYQGRKTGQAYLHRLQVLEAEAPPAHASAATQFAQVWRRLLATVLVRTTHTMSALARQRLLAAAHARFEALWQALVADGPAQAGLPAAAEILGDIHDGVDLLRRLHEVDLQRPLLSTQKWGELDDAQRATATAEALEAAGLASASRVVRFFGHATIAAVVALERWSLAESKQIVVDAGDFGAVALTTPETSEQARLAAPLALRSLLPAEPSSAIELAPTEGRIVLGLAVSAIVEAMLDGVPTTPLAIPAERAVSLAAPVTDATARSLVASLVVTPR